MSSSPNTKRPSSSFSTIYLHDRTQWRDLFLLLASNDSDLLGELGHVGQELGLTGDVFAQHFGDLEAIGRLVVLHDAAEGSLGSAEGL